MTRTEVTACGSTGSENKGHVTAGSKRARRLLTLALAAVLALAVALPGYAAAAEPTSSYNNTPTTPKEGTSPSKETESPSSTPSSATTPTAEAAKTTTLPYTGLDLRWTLLAGLVLIAAGGSLIVVQRRRADGR